MHQSCKCKPPHHQVNTNMVCALPTHPQALLSRQRPAQKEGTTLGVSRAAQDRLLSPCRRDRRAECKCTKARTFSRGCPSVCWALRALDASVSGCLPVLLLPLLGLGAVYSWKSTPVDRVLQMHASLMSLPTRVDLLHSGSMQRPLYSFLSNCVDRRPPGWACTTAQHKTKQHCAASNCLRERIARSSLIVWHVAFVHK